MLGMVVSETAPMSSSMAASWLNKTFSFDMIRTPG